VSLLDLVGHLPRIALDAGSTLRPAELPDVQLVVVEEGLIVLRSATAGSSRRTITCHAGAGALVLSPGEDEVLVALSDATLRTISTSERARFLEQPEAATALLDGLGETLRQKHTTIANIAQLRHVDRVRQTLFELARAHGRVGTGVIRLDFPLTQDLLGEMTGSARETVTRALDQLQREGLVVRQGRRYNLRVPPDAFTVTQRTLRH
jgi:CRP-like cAMP-binding protein